MQSTIRRANVNHAIKPTNTTPALARCTLRLLIATNILLVATIGAHFYDKLQSNARHGGGQSIATGVTCLIISLFALNYTAGDFIKPDQKFPG
jgi:hypothetical protein